MREKLVNARPNELQFLITATRLPSDAIEIQINSLALAKKIAYILEAYDDEMHLKTNPAIYIVDILLA